MLYTKKYHTKIGKFLGNSVYYTKSHIKLVAISSYYYGYHKNRYCKWENLKILEKTENELSFACRNFLNIFSNKFGKKIAGTVLSVSCLLLNFSMSNNNDAVNITCNRSRLSRFSLKCWCQFEGQARKKRSPPSLSLSKKQDRKCIIKGVIIKVTLAGISKINYYWQLKRGRPLWWDIIRFYKCSLKCLTSKFSFILGKCDLNLWISCAWHYDCDPSCGRWRSR